MNATNKERNDNKMEKQKNTQMFVIAILAVALLTMSVGFAAFSSVLNINGTANVKASSWNVHFNTASYNETTGTNYVSVAAANRTIEATSMTYTVDLPEPGKTYQFTIDVENTGTFDAVLKSMTITSLNENVAKYLTYTVTYNNSTPAEAANTTLAKETGRATVKVTVAYVQPALASDLPSTNQTVTLDVSLNYEQAA